MIMNRDSRLKHQFILIHDVIFLGSMFGTLFTRVQAFFENLRLRELLEVEAAFRLSLLVQQRAILRTRVGL